MSGIKTEERIKYLKWSIKDHEEQLLKDLKELDKLQKEVK